MIDLGLSPPGYDLSPLRGSMHSRAGLHDGPGARAAALLDALAGGAA